MKTFGLKSGENYVDNGYGHIYGIGGGKITNVEVYSDSPGTVTVKQKAKGFDKEMTVATVTVGNDGYGTVGGLGALFGYGDTLTVTGIPVESGNKYSVRCYYE